MKSGILLLGLSFLFAQSLLAVQRQKPHIQPQALQQKPLPEVPTKINIHALMGTSVTAGDIIELEVRPPVDLTDASPELPKIEQEPVIWGTGRILWWKAYDPKTELIVLGLTTYTPGKFEISPIPFQKNGKRVFTTQPQTVEFTSLGGDKGKDDIYPPMGVAVPMWVWVAIGVLSFTLIASLGWGVFTWLRKRKQRKDALFNKPKILTPLEEFEKTKNLTLEKGFLAKALYKPHYFSLSDASKRFLGKSFHFDAEERTTRELVQDLEGLDLTENLINQWKDLFDEMDVTKFTDQIPLEKNAKTLAIRLSHLVNQTYHCRKVTSGAV